MSHVSLLRLSRELIQFMILLRIKIQNQIHKTWKERINRDQNTIPPWNHQHAPWMFRYLDNALRNIRGREMRIFELLDIFARTSAFEFFAKFGGGGTWINSRNTNPQ